MMPKVRIFTVILFCLFSTNTLARDTVHHLSVSDAMDSSDFQERLDPNISFYFGNQSYSEPSNDNGEFITNKKTNAVGKSDAEACEWVLLSALISLQERAIAEGGNAIVDIVSYYKREEFLSDAEYECHAGRIMAGVALKGRVVTIP